MASNPSQVPTTRTPPGVCSLAPPTVSEAAHVLGLPVASPALGAIRRPSSLLRRLLSPLATAECLGDSPRTARRTGRRRLSSGAEGQLASEPKNKIASLPADLGAAWAPLRIGPPSGDEPAGPRLRR